MKVSLTAAALALGLAAVQGSALAQSSTHGSTASERTITVGSTDPTPESPSAARHEAAAALAQAKRDCRKEQGQDARNDCLAAAREDYRKLMAEANGRRNG